MNFLRKITEFMSRVVFLPMDGILYVGLGRKFIKIPFTIKSQPSSQCRISVFEGRQGKPVAFLLFKGWLRGAFHWFGANTCFFYLEDTDVIISALQTVKKHLLSSEGHEVKKSMKSELDRIFSEAHLISRGRVRKTLMGRALDRFYPVKERVLFPLAKIAHRAVGRNLFVKHSLPSVSRLEINRLEFLLSEKKRGEIVVIIKSSYWSRRLIILPSDIDDFISVLENARDFEAYQMSAFLKEAGISENNKEKNYET